MKNIKSISLLILLFLISSCGPALTSLYKSDFPLTSRRVFSRTGELSLKIPEGWFSVEDNEKNFFDVWLVEDNYKSYMTLVPLTLDEESKVSNGVTRIENLIKYSKYFKTIEKGAENFENGEEIFELNDRFFGAYIYKTGDTFSERVIVFDYKNSAFEFSAICNHASCDSLNLMELYRIQNSILTSIKE